MMNHVKLCILEFLSQYSDDFDNSESNFSVLLQDGTVVDKEKDELWISTTTIHTTNTDEDFNSDSSSSNID